MNLPSLFLFFFFFPFLFLPFSSLLQTLDYVYGFKCDMTNQVLHVEPKGADAADDRDCTFVFPAAGVGVVQHLDVNDDFSTHSQTFLGNDRPILVRQEKTFINRRGTITICQKLNICE